MDEKLVGAISLQEPLSWKVYIDGAANHKGSRVGLVLVSPERITIEKSLRLGFSAINNEAKYETLLVGMTMVQKMGGKAVDLLLEELHEGICGSHTRGRSLSHRALTQGYWWLNMQKEA